MKTMPPKYPHNVFQAVLKRARQSMVLDRRDLTVLMSAGEGAQQDALFAAARMLREQHFGNCIFLYGFVYTSTYCRNDCTFCYYRRSNVLLPRYRKKNSDVITAIRHLAEQGIHLIDLTMGEDPVFFTESTKGFDALVALVTDVQSITGLPVMISPGVVSDRVLQKLSTAGATWYACYQETHNREHFRRLRPGQSYKKRMDTKRRARAIGLLVEEGLLCGIGETDADLVESILQMRTMDVDQVRVMTFIPQPQTPLKDWPAVSDRRELITMAVLRLAFPNLLIPASLDVRGLNGLRERLRAGANVVTSIVPPGLGLAGVANSSLDIESSRRTSACVKNILSEEGLKTADLATYRRWIEARMAKNEKCNCKGIARCG